MIIYHFQNLDIDNATLKTKPIVQWQETDETANTEKKEMRVVFIRDPYDYFDALLFTYIKEKRSILFTQDIINHMKRDDGKTFITWLDTINFIPLYNPQTFQLDISKKLESALMNLEQFDYVVPYKEIDLFLEKVPSNISISKKEEKKLNFSMHVHKKHPLAKKFVGMDMELYEKACELWDIVKKQNFKPLGTLIKRKKATQNDTKPSKKKYEGVLGKITSHSIRGWVVNKKEPQHAVTSVSIYKNGKFLCILKADKMREDLKKQKIHPSGKCGFEMTFDDETFNHGDKVEVKILPEKVNLPLGDIAKMFLGI